MTEKLIKAAGLIIFRKTDTGKPLFLVVLDSNDNWGFPKGHQEEGESLIDTALREAEEEVGIKKDELDIIDGFEKKVDYTLEDGTKKQVTYFLAQTDKQDLQINQDEIKKYAWLLTYEAIGRVTFMNNAMLINDAREFLMEQEEYAKNSN